MIVLGELKLDREGKGCTRLSCIQHCFQNEVAQLALFTNHYMHTVLIVLENISDVRITPNVFTTIDLLYSPVKGITNTFRILAP